MPRRPRKQRLFGSTASAAHGCGSTSCFGRLLSLLDLTYYITKLPLEILMQIVENFFVKHEILIGISRESAADLASIARVSRLFYHIAMPLLWREAQIWPSRIKPYSLLKHPGTSSERVLNYIQEMTLNIDAEDESMDKTKCNRLWKYVSRCLRVLVAAGSIRRLSLSVRLYNPNEYAPELSNKFKAINDLTFRILRQTDKMRLDTLWFYPGRETASICDIMSIIERKINVLDVNSVPLDGWVDRLHNFQNLTKIDVCRSDPFYEGDGNPRLWIVVSAEFWIAISQLKNVTHINIENIPIFPILKLQFPQLISLSFCIWLPFAGPEVSDSLISILRQMPNLETLSFYSWGNEFEQHVNELEIHEIECRNLRTVQINPIVPKHLVATIAKQNPNLTSCSFGGANVDDLDIRYLSGCQRLRSLNLESSVNVTNSLVHLTNLQQLDTLKLHYSVGKYMSTQLLLDVSSSCLNLQKIEVSDFLALKNTSVPRPFGDLPLTELFAAGVEFHQYIEPSYKKDVFVTVERLDKYIIRLDRIREDRDQFQSLSFE